jgi:hypothetical protein
MLRFVFKTRYMYQDTRTSSNIVGSDSNASSLFNIILITAPCDIIECVNKAHASGSEQRHSHYPANEESHHASTGSQRLPSFPFIFSLFFLVTYTSHTQISKCPSSINPVHPIQHQVSPNPPNSSPAPCQSTAASARSSKRPSHATPTPPSSGSSVTLPKAFFSSPQPFPAADPRQPW